MKTHALLFTGGKGPENLMLPPSLIESSYICAADSGLDLAHSFNLSVDYAIGDFDSIRQELLLADVEHTRLPSEKDISDTEALLEHLRELGITEYTLVGGGEGRFDHLLHLYSLFSAYSPPRRWLTERERMMRIDDTEEISVEAGTTVSFFPGKIDGSSYVTCAGLQWPLKAFHISYTSMSLSNVTVEGKLHISVQGDPVFLSFPSLHS